MLIKLNNILQICLEWSNAAAGIGKARSEKVRGGWYALSHATGFRLFSTHDCSQWTVEVNWKQLYI